MIFGLGLLNFCIFCMKSMSTKCHHLLCSAVNIFGQNSSKNGCQFQVFRSLIVGTNIIDELSNPLIPILWNQFFLSHWNQKLGAKNKICYWLEFWITGFMKYVKQFSKTVGDFNQWTTVGMSNCNLEKVPNYNLQFPYTSCKCFAFVHSEKYSGKEKS